MTGWMPKAPEIIPWKSPAVLNLPLHGIVLQLTQTTMAPRSLGTSPPPILALDTRRITKEDARVAVTGMVEASPAG